MNILVTGAAGFIGSNFVHYYTAKHPEDKIVVLDKLTYAGNLANLAPFIASDGSSNDERVKFVKGDICDRELVKNIFSNEDISGVIHFAAESHVDNSIKNPSIFVETNVLGTQVLLDAAKAYWGEGANNKFVHISTDEVFGSLAPKGSSASSADALLPHSTLSTAQSAAPASSHLSPYLQDYFTEKSPYQPNSPYSASKAGSDMIARAYYETFKMNINITNCSNNYGPYQHAEKLIPTIIRKALADEKVPVYGDGMNVRDWLYVEDHCKAIDMVFHNAAAGERYCIGGHNEMHNIDIVKLILGRLDKSEDLIEFVTDRKGHDFRYAIDPTKITEDLGWVPDTKFADGIVKTVDWYLGHTDWLVA
ncbi:dTDP-glucose 4,6-dehydratase [Candidatus Saccharibacteria bacterium]|nr:dTDP-glucose 4,6-dehydratase [Candidatus Saccharibacteria bacterium]